MNINTMKCTRCKGPATIRMPSHNLRMCAECFDIYFKRQIEKALKKYEMIDWDCRIGMAVSGGKDSLVLWQALTEMDIMTTAFHIDLGLGPFSDKSKQACMEMADSLSRPCEVVSVKDVVGLSIVDIVRGSRRQFCSVCGTIKRHVMNRYIKEKGLNVICSGHNLDDEVARLLGNLIYQRTSYIENMWPTLPETEGLLPRKIKPLIRLDSHEIRSFAKIKGISYLKEKCPKSKGATSHYFQDALADLEANIPGLKRSFYFGYLRNNTKPEPKKIDMTCKNCGLPTHIETCSACRLVQKAMERINEKKSSDS